MKIKAQYIGLDEYIDQQVLMLIQNGIVNTSSIVISSQHLNKCLKDVKRQSKIRGLMLNLTQGISTNTSSNGFISIEEYKNQIQNNQLSLDVIKSEVRAQIYQYISIFDELPQHIDGLGEIHQIPEIAEIISQIMEQEFGVYEVHFQLRNMLANVEMSQQIQNFNKLIKIYCSHNIKPVIFMEQDDLYSYKESLNKINQKLEYDHTCNLSYGITLTKLGVSDITSQQIPQIMTQKRLSQSSQKINQIIRKISSDKEDQTKTNIMIYSKINPATGNQTFALRLKKILDLNYDNCRKVYFRGIDQFNQKDKSSFDNEVINLTKFVKDYNIGMCLGINVYRTSILLSKVKQNVNFDLVSIIAGTDAYEFLDDESIAQQMKEACENSSLIVSINEEMKQNFVKKLDILGEKIHVVNQSIDLSLASTYNIRQKLGLKENDCLILFPAGVRKVKNCKFLIEPMKELLLKYPNHYLVHVGSVLEQQYYNEYTNEIEKMKDQYPSIKNRYIFYGSLDYPSYLGALKQSNLILNCSFSEGQCNSILEAMGSNILTLISRIEGNLSICKDHQTSLMFDGKEEFISLYDYIFNEQINTSQIIQNAQQTFQECYDFTIEAQGFSNLFIQIDKNNTN